MDKQIALTKLRLAIIVSHPVQYYVPLYKALATRNDVEVKLFFTWHAGQKATYDQGFQQPIAWDIPLTDGYDWELVQNLSRNPGTHHFFGLRNPTLMSRIAQWRPDVVHITGWPYASHLLTMRACYKKGIPVIFRGDSHLLDGTGMWPKGFVKKEVLRRVFSWPSLCLYVGNANRQYYKHFGVEEARLAYCPHSIDVKKFTDYCGHFEAAASRWKRSLGLAEKKILLFAGKFEAKKQPLELIQAFEKLEDDSWALVMVGSGELEEEIKRKVSGNRRYRVLPFANQSEMPVIYRLADVFILPSAWGETWGLSVNEALACARPVIVSEKVGCAAEVVEASCGWRFVGGEEGLIDCLKTVTHSQDRFQAMREAAQSAAKKFDIRETEHTLLDAAVSLRERACMLGVPQQR